MIDNCKFCQGPLIFELETQFNINNKIETIDVESCPTCKTPFLISETYSPKSKHRVFKKLISRDMAQEEFTFDDGIELLKEYSEQTSYVGKYIFAGKIVTRTGEPYRVYEIITSFDIFDISNLSTEQLHKKLKLYLTFL